MDSLKQVSSPSLSSSPSTKEQSTEQPKSNERKSLKEEDKADLTPSNIQTEINEKKQKQNDYETKIISNIKNFSLHEEEQDDREEGENSKSQSVGLHQDQLLSSLTGSGQHYQEGQEILSNKQQDKEEDLNEDDDLFEEDEYDEEEEDFDEDFLDKEGDNGFDTTEDGNKGVKQKKNKFTKEFISAIKSNSEELRNEKNDDPLDYLFVIDFECNQPGSEIIEFPITVVDLKQKKVVDTFHSYVRPTKIKKLSNFIKKLTGIKQEDVDASDSIDTILTKVEAFLSKYQSFKAAILYDCANDAKFLSNEIKNKHLTITNKLLLSYINLRNVFPIHLTGGIKNISLSHALEVLDMSFEGQKHTGKDDSINIARVCIEMINHQFIFTQFMRQSQFCSDNPKKLVDSTINDLFTMNKYLIAIDIQFYGDKKDLNTKHNIILCKQFNFHLFQVKKINLDSSSPQPSNLIYQTPPQKSNFKLKTSAEKHAEQQLLQQQKALQQQKQQQQEQQQQPEKQIQDQKIDTYQNQNNQKQQDQQSSQAQPNSNLNQQQQQKQDIPQQQQQQQKLKEQKQYQIEEIDSYQQEFDNLQYQLQDYFELLQNLIDLYHKHGIKCQNSLIILNSSTKQKYFSKLFKFVTAMFKTNKTAFIFKKKIVNLQEVLERQIVIDQKTSDLIMTEDFPQNIIKLFDFFQTENFLVKELPSCFQKKTVSNILEGQPSQYREGGSYPYQYYDSPQYGQYINGFYNQKQQPTSNIPQQNPYAAFQQQYQQNVDYFNPTMASQNLNQFSMMYQLQQQAQFAFNQQNASLGNQQHSPYYMQQAMNQMSNNYIYQMPFFNPAAFSFPPNSIDSQLQQQILFQSQQFLSQLEQNSSQSATFPPQNHQQAQQQQHQQSPTQSYNYKQNQYQSQSSPSINQHQKTNSTFAGNYPSQNSKNNSNNQKSEGSNISRKKNFRNNSQSINGYSGYQNNGFYYDSFSSGSINSGNSNFQKNNQSNSNNSQINSSPLIAFPPELNNGQAYKMSQPTLYNSYIQNGLNKQNTFNSQNKNKFYKK